MRSVWSSKNAKKLADTYQRSIKNFHPETVKAIRHIFENIKVGNKISFHGIPYIEKDKVTKELRSLGYTVINHGTFVAPDTVKFEVQVV